MAIMEWDDKKDLKALMKELSKWKLVVKDISYDICKVPRTEYTIERKDDEQQEQDI